ncbi:hypothetical protein ACIOD2_02315 [Amycolatopsis sp. NPDC088138]|uniref:hypothetical protein n=1 Tax=Amycolatopsis sp. NPDC088138 TaxID=3363938 RepID=UPI0038121478
MWDGLLLSWKRKMNIGLWFAVASLGIALIGVPAAWANWRRIRRERGRGRFKQVLDHVRVGQGDLHQAALIEADMVGLNARIPMLAKADWIPDCPLSLECVKIHWIDPTQAGDRLTVARRNAKKLMPFRDDKLRYENYSQALGEMGQMSKLYNGFVYRPMAVRRTKDKFHLSFTEGKYFDHLDTSEVLAYEAASRVLAGKNIMSGPYRVSIGDPFDLAGRGTSLGVVTLTVRVSESSCGFYMHHRSNDGVIAGPDILHVIPAGEFTPADVSLESRKSDRSIWKTMVREYAEEFLDVEEAYGRSGRPIDYEGDYPFSAITRARESGKLKVYFLGMGLDALTLKPEILLVSLVEATAFDAIFAEMVPDGKEGTILVGPRKEGILFNKKNVDHYAKGLNTRSAGRSCLMLTWQHRKYLNLPVAGD